MDEWTRDALRLGSRPGRDAAKTTSDVLLISMVGAPLIAEVAESDWRGFALDGVTFIGTTAVTGLTKIVADRERPFVRECADDPGYDKNCGTDYANQSFFSGHASTTFTSAALICADYEGWCGVSLGAAGVTSLLRILSDQHYLTDVLVGAGVGFALGWYVPKWLGPTFRPSVTPETAALTMQLRF